MIYGWVHKFGTIVPKKRFFLMYSLTLVVVSGRECGLLIMTCFANYWSIDIIMSIRVWKVSRCGSSCLFSLSLSLPLLAGDLQEGQMWVNIQLHPNYPLPHKIPQRLIVRHIYILWTFLEQEMHGNWLFCPFKEYIFHDNGCASINM